MSENSNLQSDISRRVNDQAEAMLDDLIAVRRDIHAHPELRFKEVRTAGIAAEALRNLGIETQTGIGKTGVVGILKGGLGDGKALGIRFDMDALPIQEKSDVPYRSLNDGVMHACGHDVHTTVGIGLARLMAGMRDDFKGTVKFIFQPSEENPFGERCGSLAMIDDGVLENPSLDGIMSLHCWPQLDVGQVGVGPGPAMAGAVAFEIIVDGQAAHGAAPHEGRDSILGAAEIISKLYHIVSRRSAPSDSIALTIHEIQGGCVQSVVGGPVRMAGTVRTVSKELMDYILNIIRDTVEGIARVYDLQQTLTIGTYYPPVVNDKAIDDIVTSSARRILGAKNVVVQTQCPMTAEDFSLMTDRVPGYYLKLGVANDEMGIRYPLHNECFNVDERCLTVGVRVLADAALTYLNG